jgi:hypothetical protein
MHKYIVVAAALAMALGLAGCSGDKGSSQAGTAEGETTFTASAAPKPVENIDKTWTFDYMGAKGTFKLTGDDADPQVQGVEAARATVDGKPVTLVPVTIDNTAGTSSINMYSITVVTKDGQQIESADLSDYFQEWTDAAGDDTDKYNALIDAENKYDMFDLQPGAKGTALVAFDAPLTSAWRVTVEPAGAGDPVEASAK